MFKLLWLNFLDFYSRVDSCKLSATGHPARKEFPRAWGHRTHTPRRLHWDPRTCHPRGRTPGRRRGLQASCKRRASASGFDPGALRSGCRPAPRSSQRGDRHPFSSLRPRCRFGVPVADPVSEETPNPTFCRMGPWAFRARARGRAAGGGPRRRGRGPRGQGADLADRRPPAREKPPPTDRWPGTPVCRVGPHARHSAPQSPVVAQAAAGVVPERPQRDAGFPGPQGLLTATPQHRCRLHASHGCPDPRHKPHSPHGRKI